MKALILVTLTLLLASGINAQMSLQDPLLNLDRNMEYMWYKPASVIEKRNPTYYGAAAVLFSTFFVNEVIIKNAENTGNFKNTARNVGTVYVAGVTLTIVICVLKSRKARKWDKLYEDQRLLEDQQERWNAWDYHKQIFGN